MSSKAKSINLFLSSGELSGLVNITEKGEWENGELFLCPRENVRELFLDDVCKKFGVYLLISKNKVYVGQSGNLKHRIEQHLIGKDWWEKVVLLTKKDNSLERSDIDYLEARLIGLATECGTIDIENKTKGNAINKKRFDIQLLDQYLDEALFLMELVGVTVFQKKKSTVLIDSIPTPSQEEMDIRSKDECLKFLQNKGMTFSSSLTYAKAQEKRRMRFWANPNVRLLREEWFLVLNNQISKEITVLKVPANTLSYSFPKENGKLTIRKDMRNVIDLNLDCTTFVDIGSNINFSPFIVANIDY